MGCLSFTAFPRLNFLITKEYKRVKSIYALGDDVKRNFCRQTQLIPEKLYIREYTSENLRKNWKIEFRQLWIPVLLYSQGWKFGVNFVFVLTSASAVKSGLTNQTDILYKYKFSGLHSPQIESHTKKSKARDLEIKFSDINKLSIMVLFEV